MPEYLLPTPRGIHHGGGAGGFEPPAPVGFGFLTRDFLR